MDTRKQHQTVSEDHQPDDRRRYIAYREYRRGKQDGRLGFSVSGLSAEYLEGYMLGRKLHHGLLKG
jgi:serine/threonine protein phosphatase PrpC